MRRSRRRSRKNAFWGRPRLHSRAARKGWGRKRARRSRRNAGTLSIRNTTRSLTKGFSLKVGKRAVTILGGNVLTTLSEGMIASRVPFLRSHPIAEIFSLFFLASAAGVAVAKSPLKKFVNASDVLIGGMLAGITRGAKLLFPGSFTTCGLGDDMDGLGSYYASPNNFVIGTDGHSHGMLNMPGRYPQIAMHGMGSYAHVGQPLTMTGMDAYASPGAVHPNLLDGLAANAEVSNEIGAMM